MASSPESREARELTPIDEWDPPHGESFSFPTETPDSTKQIDSGVIVADEFQRETLATVTVSAAPSSATKRG